MKTNFMAGLIASLISLFVTVGIAILMVTVFDMDAEGRVPYIIAFLVIAIWTGLYRLLKPKDPPSNDQNASNSTNTDTDIPARRG